MQKYHGIFMSSSDWGQIYVPILGICKRCVICFVFILFTVNSKVLAAIVGTVFETFAEDGLPIKFIWSGKLHYKVV